MKKDIQEVEYERDRLAIALLTKDDPDLIEAAQSFFFEMKAKLGRKHVEGWTKWATEDDEGWTVGTIKKLLIDHVKSGDPVDVANFALFWWYHKERIEREQPEGK